MKTGQGLLSRLGIGTQVLVTSVLALAAVLLVNWLAGRPGLRLRQDLTATGQNTLSTAAQGVVDRLPGTVTIDIFFRPEEQPLTGVAQGVQDRTLRLLGTLRQVSAGRIEVRQNDTGDREATEQRLRELKLRGYENCLVVSYGEAREVLRLVGDLAVFDPGSPPPDPQPPRIVAYEAERAIVQGLLAVTRGQTRHVYFSTGQGERDVFSDDVEGMGDVQSMLAAEGLVVGRWSPVEDGPLPEDCDLLSIIGPQDGFDELALDRIEAYVRDGGRLVLVPHELDEALDRSRLGELAERFGIEIQHGTVCQPYADTLTGNPRAGDMKVLTFFIHPDNMARHALLGPIRAARRSFAMSVCHPVRVSRQPSAGVATPLFRSTADAWVDNQRPGAVPWNYLPDGDEAQARRFDLAVASNFRPAAFEETPALEETPESRIVVVGSSGAFSNQAFRTFNGDFLRNVYSWVLDREYRISISTRDPDVRRLPMERSGQVARISQVAWGWIPGACLLAGLVTAFLRSRGGPPRRRRPSSPARTGERSDTSRGGTG